MTHDTTADVGTPDGGTPADLTPAGDARFREAIARIDAAHAEDPARETIDGVEHPGELLYARRMSERLASLAPEASEALKLAVRCQHIRRWTLPRSAYSMDVDGYRAWRTEEGRRHAETAGRILAEVGYDETTIQRVQSLVKKERLKRDPETQLLEDVTCLVFLEHYLPEFAAKHDEETLIGILRKTWKKMSERGQQAALGLALAPRLRSLVAKALGRP